MPKHYAALAAYIAGNRLAMIALIVLAGLGLPAFGMFQDQFEVLGPIVGILWGVILVVIWFQPGKSSNLGPLWVWALGLDVWFLSCVALLVAALGRNVAGSAA